MAFPCSLGFSQHGGWVPRGSIPKVSVLGGPSGSCKTFCDLILKKHTASFPTYSISQSSHRTHLGSRGVEKQTPPLDGGGRGRPH